MEKETAVNHVSVEKAAAMLNKSAHSVRQLVGRDKIGHEKIGRNVVLLLDDVLHYYSRKKKIACWEDNIETLKDRSFVSVDYTSAALMVQPGYVLKLVKDKLLEGYITFSGDIMIAKDSINSYLGRIDHDKHTL